MRGLADSARTQDLRFSGRYLQDMTQVLDSLVGPQGFEPWTDGLKDRCPQVLSR